MEASNILVGNLSEEVSQPHPKFSPILVRYIRYLLRLNRRNRTRFNFIVKIREKKYRESVYIREINTDSIFRFRVI